MLVSAMNPWQYVFAAQVIMAEEWHDTLVDGELKDDSHTLTIATADNECG